MVEKVSELSIHEKEAVKREELIESPSVKSTSDEAPLLSKKNQQKNGEGSGISLMGIEEMEVKYAAYVRHDAFGTFGRGPFPLKEKILLGVAMLTLLPIRVVLALVILLLYYVVCKLCTCFSVAESEGEDGPAHYGHMSGFRRSVIVKAGRFLSRAMLFTFGFYWIKVNKLSGDDVSEENEVAPLESPVRPGAIISNHVSYLDILYHMADSFPSFVAKRSVAKLPLVGLISKCLGCVYVQRESKSSNFKGVSGIVAERLQTAHSNKDAPLMMLFPEGTTTNGDYLLPFKTGAFLAKTPVQPVILRYPYRRFSPAWDSISGARHVIFLLCQFVNHIEATRLPVYCPTDEEKADAKLYAENVRKLMALQGNLTMSDIGLPEKRIYHAALNGNDQSSTLHQKRE